MSILSGSGATPDHRSSNVQAQKNNLTPQEFIQTVLINDIGTIVNNRQPWIAFAMMAIGIEFLGKCLDSQANDWNRSKSKTNFEDAINHLNPFIQYRPYIQSHKLWDSLRNGFAHSFVIKGDKIGLSSDLTPNQNKNLTFDNGRMYLKCEDFYYDFKLACKEVMAKQFPNATDKMNRPLIYMYH